MDRQTLKIQAQANKYIELEKAGFSVVQFTEFENWLNACDAHRIAYEETKQINTLLTQFNDDDIARLCEQEQPLLQKNANDTPIENKHGIKKYYAIAACCALFMLSVLSYRIVPTMLLQTPFIAQYQSKHGELLEYTLPDNSHITLDAKTQLSLVWDNNRRTSNLLSGRVLFDVESDKTRPFVVNAGKAKVSVLGTRFSVDKKENRVLVAVAHGKVAVQLGGHSALLRQGEVAVISEHGIKLDIMDHFNVGAWQQGRLVFNNEPLVSVLQTFNRYHNRTVIFTDQQAEQVRLSGVFSASELDEFISLLPDALSVEVKVINNQIVISFAK